KVGAEVEISAMAAGENQKVSLLKGEITAIEPEFLSGHISCFTVRGYDLSHRLHRGRYSRTFLKQSDVQIAQKIAGECSLGFSSSGSPPTHDYVLQDNQTNMEFLQDRARRIGRYVYVDDGKLYFVKEPENRGEVELVWGEDLMDFRARLTTAEQVSEVEARGWDPVAKKEIWSKTSAYSPDIVKVKSKDGKTTAEAAFGKTEECVVNYALRTNDEVKLQAQSVLDTRGHAFFTAEGTCQGNPNVKAGVKARIVGIGTRFSGTYRLSRSMHCYDSSGYTTRFEISGNHANTLGHLLSGNGGSPHNSSGRGVVVGQVTNIEDPDDLARVKVKYPTFGSSSAEIESNWARLVTPMAGAERGIEFIPEVDDEVLVAFENNDVNHPYILGALWNNTDKPPLPTSEAVGGGKVNKRVIKSRSGHTITIDDTDGEEKISIIDKTEKNSVEIDSANNAIAIKSDADITINAAKNITIEGKGDLTLKGKKIEIAATQGGDMNLKAMNLTAEATTKATLKGGTGVLVEGLKTEVKGTQTSINGDAMTEVKGGIVKIN
ncbi:VgrG-related protein, partial [Chloroflexota bacterium]